MALKIMPHGRLQEWVAEEKGFFTAEGLEYSFIITGDYGLSSVQRDEAQSVVTGDYEAVVQPLGREEALLFGNPFL